MSVSSDSIDLGIEGLFSGPVESGSPALDEWMEERVRFASCCLDESVTIDPDVRSGIPVVRGSRFSVATLLAELSEGNSIDEIADDLDLDREKLEKILLAISIYLDRSFVP